MADNRVLKTDEYGTLEWRGPTVYAYVPNFNRFRIFCSHSLGSKNPKIYRIANYNILMAPPSGVEIKRCTTTTLSRSGPKIPKSFPYSNALMAKRRSQTSSFESVTDKKWKKVKKNMEHFRAPAVCEVRAITNFAWRLMWAVSLLQL